MSYLRVYRPLMIGALVAFQWPALALAQGAEPAEMGYGWLLFRMVVLLSIVCIFAYIVLRWGVRRFVAPDQQVGPMSVVARLPVEPRRSILLIKVGERCLVVGSSEAGMTSLGEIPADELEIEKEPDGRRTFADVLHRFRAQPQEVPEDEGQEEVFHVKHEEAS